MNDKDFINWVINIIFNGNDEGDWDWFSEIACRKLYKMGYIDKEGCNWIAEVNNEDLGR